METNNGLMHDNLSVVNEPWRQAPRQAPKIGVPSPSFAEWKQIGEEALEIFPGRRLPSETLENWDLDRSIHLRREAAQDNRWARETAAQAAELARKSAPDLELAVEGATSYLAFNLLRQAQAKVNDARSHEIAMAAFGKLARWIEQKHRRAGVEPPMKMKPAADSVERERPARQQPRESQPQSDLKPKAKERVEPALGEQPLMKPLGSTTCADSASVPGTVRGAGTPASRRSG